MSRTSQRDARGRIREAAIDLFSERGFDATSVREIVERAGVSKPTLYYYFENKAGLARELLLETSREFREVTLGTSHTQGSLSEMTASVIWEHCQYVTKHLKFMRFLFSTVFGNSGRAFLGSVLELSRESRRETENLIRRSAVRSGFSQGASSKLAETVISVIYTEIMRLVAGIEPRMTRRKARDVAVFLVSGAKHFSQGDDH